MFSGLVSLLGWLSLGDSGQEGPSLSGRGLNTSPSPEAMKTVGLASDGAQLIGSGLSAEVVEAILHSRAPSTRKQYALKCRVFTSWCGNRLLDPADCPLGTVLSSCRSGFLQGWLPPPFSCLWLLTTFLWVVCHWGETLWYLVSSLVCRTRIGLGHL